MLESDSSEPTVPEVCPSCRAPKRRNVSYKTFGDSWKICCGVCAHILASGVGNVPEGIK